MFDPLTALNYARQVSRPRLVGSGEDRVVAEEIVARLDGFGYRVEREPFRFSTAFDTLLFLIVAVAVLLVLFGLFGGMAPWWNPATSLLLLALLVAFEPLSAVVRRSSIAASSDRLSPFSSLCFALGRKYETENLVAHWHVPAASDCPHLILMAHYDSKSQPYPLAVRMALITGFIGGGVAFAILSLLQLVTPQVATLVLLSGAVTVLAGIPLLFLSEGNNSPGAIDNASGVGLVLHLAEWLAAEQALLRALRVTVLIPSAEEFAVLGATEFLRVHKAALREEQARGTLHILNFDGVGVDGDLQIVTTANRRRGDTAGLVSLVSTACGALDIPLRTFRLPGVLFDHIPFAESGLDAVSLAATAPASWSVHTPADSAERLGPKGFDQAGRATIELMHRLAGATARGE